MVRRSMVLFASCAILAAGCKGKPDAQAKESDASSTAIPVEVVPAVEEEVVRRVDVTGTLAPWEEGVVAFQGEGTLADLAVDLGDTVRKGQVLARVDPQAYDLRRQQAEAELAAAQADFGRVSQLAGKDMATRQQVDESRRRQDIARTAVALARKALADAVVRAPFDGRIAKRYANEGEYVRTGNPAFQIVRIEPLKLKCDVPERYGQDVGVGDRVEVRSESFAGGLGGEISRIGPSVAVDSRSFPVEARIDNPGAAVKPGTFARAAITVSGTVRGVLVPDSAVTMFAGNPRVFVVVDGKARERTVELGVKDGSRVMVKSGVAAGEPVVVTGAALLSDGSAVAIR